MRHVVVPQNLTNEAMRPPAADARRVDVSGETMGTRWSVACFVRESLTPAIISVECERVFARISKEMSNWDQASTVSRFNAAEKDARISFSSEGKFVLEAALKVAAQSAGAFNPYLGHLTESLHFGKPNQPSLNDIAPESEDQPWSFLQMPSAGQPLRQPGGVKLDLSAIAKGYAVDQMGELLSQLGLTSYLAEIGGEFLGRGAKPDGQPWWVTIESPKSSQSETFVVALAGLAVATSGIGHRFHQGDNGSAPHIVSKSPLTSADLKSVSVFHPSCMIADAWATALFAAGPEMGMAIADRLDIAALFQAHEAPFTASAAMDGLLQ